MSRQSKPSADTMDEPDSPPSPQIPYRRERTPSIVVQSLGLSFNKNSNITESIELEANDEDDDPNFSEHNESSEASEPRSSTSVGGLAGVDEACAGLGGACDSSCGGSARGSSSSLQNSSSPISTNVNSPTAVRQISAAPAGGAQMHNKPAPNMQPANANRRLSLNIGSCAPRRQSLTVDGLASLATAKDQVQAAAGAGSGYAGGGATGSLRNKVALKPGHSLMGWIKLASTAENLSGTNGKIIEVTPDELSRHDSEQDCWVALKGNVYNVTTYLQYHPGGVHELMRGAGRDATDLFNEIHRWVNYESILAKCLVGPYKLESPISASSPIKQPRPPVGRILSSSETATSPPPTTTTTTATGTASSNATSPSATATTTGPHNTVPAGPRGRGDPTVAHRPSRRQSIALTVPSPNKYQSLLLNNIAQQSLNQVQNPPTYVIMQDKLSIKLKIQDLSTLSFIRSRHLICDLSDQIELHVSVILSPDWLYRIHLRFDQQIEQQIRTEFSLTQSDLGYILLQLNKREPSIWTKIGTSMDLNDSLCEMTLADKFFRSCKLVNKTQLTHDTYMFEFKLENTLMYVPIGWHVLIRQANNNSTNNNKQNSPTNQIKSPSVGKDSVGETLSSTSSVTSTTTSVTNLSNSTSSEASKTQSASTTSYEAQMDTEYRVHKNYTCVMPSLLDDNDGTTDENGFMNSLHFIIKIYPNGIVTSKLDQLKIGDRVEISDYQYVDFDIENLVMNSRHWFLFAAGTGITPFCRIISYLLSQKDDRVKSVNLVFFNKTQKDIILKDQFDQLQAKHNNLFKVTHVLSNEPENGNHCQTPASDGLNEPVDTIWSGERGRVNKDLVGRVLDSHSPDELQLLTCGPRAFTQLLKSILTELNLQEQLYVFHG